MSEQGVPVDEVTAKDFIMVRAALVRRLGGANEALVWSRIYYRCDEDSRVAHDTDSGRWWAASYEVIGGETGLSTKQARTAVERLAAEGFLLAEQHRLRSNYDRTFSYQPVVLPGIAHVPSGADASAQTDLSHLPSRANVHVPSRADVPLIETLETVEETPIVPVEIDRISVAFERAWAAWVPSRRGARKKAESSFRTAVKVVGMGQLERLLVTLESHAEAWSTWAVSEQQFVPMMSTWLNQERWTTPVPDQGRGQRRTALDTGREADAILRARMVEQKAVSA